MQNTSQIENNAKWLGFYKTSKDASLPHLVKWNIMYILVVTIWAVVLVRQFNYRLSRGKPTTRAFFMFPKITKLDADKNVRSCIKYLFNYGFFKFGVEVSSESCETWCKLSIADLSDGNCGSHRIQDGHVLHHLQRLALYPVCDEKKDNCEDLELLHGVHCLVAYHTIYNGSRFTSYFVHS
jgi:hypothetical protein